MKVSAIEVREQLEKYAVEKGIKYKFIAAQIGVSESMLCHFRKGRKELGQTKLNMLYDWLNSNV